MRGSPANPQWAEIARRRIEGGVGGPHQRSDMRGRSANPAFAALIRLGNTRSECQISKPSIATCIRRLGHQAAAAAPGGILARLGGGARHRLARIRQLPAERPDHRASGFRGPNGYAATTAAELSAQVLDKWDASYAICNCLYRVQRLQRGHGARVSPRAERLDREGMARPRSAPARLDHRADAERRIRGRRDRALRQGPALRADHGAGHEGRWAAALLADLRGRRAAGLPIGIHGLELSRSGTSLGWPSHYVEDYTSQSQGFRAR